ncbi:MAG: peptidylprolyl isomerase [Acidobacteriota bacterium]
MSPAKKIIPLGIILCFLLSACRSAPYPDGIYAELGTERGTIVLELDFERTPMTTANFIGLAEGTLTNQAFPAGRPFFDGTVFHRVVPGHVIQAGIPNGGETDSPGYTIPNEIASDLSHDRAGILGMANAGPHTNSSQFYITLGDRSYLDGNFTIFGRVTEGIPVVRSIQQGDSVQRVKILRIGKKARRFRVDNDSFNRIRTDVEQEVARMEEEKKKKEAEWIRTNWPDAVQSPHGSLFQVTQTGTGEKPRAGQTLLALYTGLFPDGTSFRSTGEDGQPFPGEEGEPFTYVIGTSSITPGLDAALADMQRGEHRTVICPPPLGYGLQGFYARQREGERRFVISPNTTLVYFVELLDFRN